jgi:hypothetical protein
LIGKKQGKQRKRIKIRTKAKDKLIDSHNKFIQITLNINKFKINFKDSYKIFPVSLNDLANILS